MQHIPTAKEKEVCEQWLRKNRPEQPHFDQAARACATNFGLWEVDIGYDGEEKEFTPLWLGSLARAIYNEK